MQNMLKTSNLVIDVEGKNIINNLNIEIMQGKVHAIMGRNGSGKSTLLKVIAGLCNDYQVSGKIEMNSNDISDMSVTDRALNGIFLSFQDPVSIPGLKVSYFLRSIVNKKRHYENKPELSPVEFMKLVTKHLENLNLSKDYLQRCVNEDFSGGEKKHLELLQILLLEPKLILIDEIDSGLDIDSLKIIAKQLKKIIAEHNSSFLIVTHYKKMLDYVEPDVVHVLSNGNIVHTGDATVLDILEDKGYKAYNEEE